MKYLVVPRARVTGASAVASSAFICPPGPLPALGFTHHLSRELGCSVTGVAILPHDFEFRAEDSRLGNRLDGALFHQFRAASFVGSKDYARTNKTALSLQPTARCDLELTLIVEFADGAYPDVDHASRFIENRRYAGGVFEPGIGERTKLYSDLESAVQGAGRGFAMLDRTDLLAPPETGPTDDILDRMLTWLDPNRDHKIQPWLLPSTLGYQTISDVRPRAGARESYPHAFVESLVGLVQYRNLFPEPPPFWRYDRPTIDTFLATTKQMELD